MITITTANGKIAVKSPYHPSFVSAVKRLNGSWNGAAGTWTVDARDEQAVRDICRQVYGTDGSDNPVLVDIRITLSGTSDDSLFDYGRLIAQRRGRDERVKLGDGVVIVDGRFPASAGSRNNPKLMNFDDVVVLEVRDVPECLVDDDCTVVRRPENDQVPQTVETIDADARPFASMTDEQLATAIAAMMHEQTLRRQQPSPIPPNGGPAALGEGDDMAGMSIRAEMAMADSDGGDRE